MIWTPAEITTKLWLDADDASTITASSGDVSQWDDKSADAHEFTAAGGVRPSITAVTQNSKPVMNFDGTEYLTCTSPNGDFTFLHNGTLYTIFTVAKFADTANPQTLEILLANNAGSGFNRGVFYGYEDRAVVSGSNDAACFQVSNGASGASGRTIWNFGLSGNPIFTEFNDFAPANTFNVLAYIADPANGTAAARAKVRTNGGTLLGNQTFSNSPNGSAPAFPLQIAASGNNSLASNVDIAEIIIVEGAVPDATRYRLEGYLAWKWGLEGSLPGGHPYESAAPTLPDTTAPTLSSPTGSATGATTIDASVDTDEGNGTLYWVATTSATGPSEAQVQAGEDHTGAAAADSGSQAVSGTGTQSVGATGLSAATGYYVHFQHQDAATNDSTVSTTAEITTDASGPTITGQPSNTTVDENTVATFTVTATGTGTLTYQWQEDTGSGFSDMTGETSATLDFTAVEADDQNDYRCVVTDDNGSTTSGSATLTVTALAPTIDTQPQAASVSEFSTATFTVAATASAGSLSYQWQEDSGAGFGNMAGETADTLSFTAALADSGNEYRVVVTDSNGSVTSSAAALTVADAAPTIDTQPSSVSVEEGQDATFTVAATGVSGTLTYQWYDASDDSQLSGETGASLTVTAALSDSGNSYYVTVTDDSGSTQSSTVTLTVTEAVVVPRQGLIDNTEPTTPSTPDRRPTVRFRSVDWAAQAASLEGEVVEVEDYIFSGRTFYRRDKLRNPKDD
jgi:hypothetical protein